jgi:phage replication O-like protein O
MANPQKENGYTPIANELFEALCSFRIPGETRLVFDTIIRKTYGFNKKEDNIANSQIVILTKMSRQAVSRSLKVLLEKRLVIKTDDKNKKGHVLKINKDFEEWIPFVIKTDDKQKRKKVSSKLRHVSSKLMTVVNKTDDKVSSKLMDTKDKRHIKDIIQKKGSASAHTPKENAERFFSGVLALVHKDPDVDVEWLKDLLKEMADKNPHVQKKIIWEEIRKFCDYWTERNHTGTRGRWEMQKTFEVDKRLATWFRRVGFGQFSADQFSKKQNKGREIIKI